MKTSPTLTATLLSLSLLCSCGLPIETLQANAEEGRVEENAPLEAARSVRINASPAVVWEKLTQVARWPEWMPHVTQTQAPAELASGQKFTWTKNGGTIHSTLARVVAPAELSWSGEVATAKAIHVWRLSEPSPGVTQVDVEETMSGFLITVFFSQAALEQDMDESLAALKTASEANAAQ